MTAAINREREAADTSQSRHDIAIASEGPHLVDGMKAMLEQHPLSAAFPAMTEADLDALAEDITTHGQREPGLLHEGMVLDGWHRYLACEKAGVPFEAFDFDGDDPVALVKSRNLHRRHLTASQRALAIVACTEWQPNGHPANRALGARLATNAEMAGEAQVGERTIKDAKAAYQAGLGDAVKDGTVSAKRAGTVAKLPPEERAAALAAKPKPTYLKKPAADTQRQAEYKSLKARIQKLAKKNAELEEKNAALAAIAESIQAFQGKEEFEAMRVLRLENQSIKRSMAGYMRENAELKREVKRLRKKLPVMCSGLKK